MVPSASPKALLPLSQTYGPYHGTAGAMSQTSGARASPVALGSVALGCGGVFLSPLRVSPGHPPGCRPGLQTCLEELKESGLGPTLRTLNVDLLGRFTVSLDQAAVLHPG